MQIKLLINSFSHFVQDIKSHKINSAKKKKKRKKDIINQKERRP